MLKPYWTFTGQLDNDDANIKENDIDVFPGQTNTGHIKCHKENNFYAMGRSELQIIVSINPRLENFYFLF